MKIALASPTRRLLLSVPLLALPAAQALAVAPGATAPAFNLQGREGAVALSALRGKLVYVDFWASWCAPCRLSFPWLNEMQTKYGPAGLQVVGINLDPQRADADKFLTRTPAQFLIAFDPTGEMGKAYDVKSMPSSVVVAPDGRVLYRHSGWREEEKGALEAKIATALQRR